MTKHEWLTCDSTEMMLAHLTHVLGTTLDGSLEWQKREKPLAGDRKLRLFACACYQILLGKQLASPDVEQSMELVDITEKFADCLISKNEFDQAHRMAELRALNNPFGDAEDMGFCVSKLNPNAAAKGLTGKRFSSILRDLVGDDPLTPAIVATGVCEPVFGKCLLSKGHTGTHNIKVVRCNEEWLTPVVTQLSQIMYDDRDFTAMPILGDALEEAGCDNVDILNHCRNGEIHVRGCWVVDLILGKK